MNRQERFANVIVSINHPQVDRVFSYAIPDELQGVVQLGSRVLVPFGASNKPTEGYVIGFCQTTDYPIEKIKSIDKTMDDFPLFSKDMLELALWLKEKCYTTLSSCLRAIMPSGISLKNEFVAVVKSSNQKEKIPTLRGKQKEVFLYLLEHGGTVSGRELTEHFSKTVTQTLKSLQDKNMLEIKTTSQAKDFVSRVKYATLNEENEQIDSLLAVALSKNDKVAQMLDLLVKNHSVAVADLKMMFQISDSTIKTLTKNGLIFIELVETRRNVLKPKDFCTEAFSLTKEQTDAILALKNMLQSPNKKPVLLHGVTGSGKTEVYMRLIEDTIAMGKQAIMLVPEIALTPQAIEVFSERFGQAVTVTHSRLSFGERFDQWKKARDGEVSVVIGPRSAIFTPFANLGIIIMDEEHEHTYRSETTPKYHTRDVAEMRGKLTDALVVFGTATPSVETYYRTQTNEVLLLTLKKRVNRAFPKVDIVDMRYELAEGNRSIFSEALKKAIEQNLQNHEQTLLFMNRRGHSTFVSCRSCGYVMACEQCDVNYTYHQFTEKLICHYCGRQEKPPQNCPVCGSKHIRFFGVGTQKIEDEIKSLFPHARILRMDADTTSRKHSHEAIISAFSRGEADILVGTQMIAKGLNFPQVSLVGIVAADLALFAGDFRSAETAFALLTQVSGRAGRAKIMGRVLLQTYNPEHYSIVFAKDNNYEDFFAHEISIRKQMCYPPFSHFFVILATGNDEKKMILVLNTLRDLMLHYAKKTKNTNETILGASDQSPIFEILGPVPCVVSKVRLQFRWKLLVKCLDEQKIKSFVFFCLEKLSHATDTSGIAFNATLDPEVMM